MSTRFLLDTNIIFRPPAQSTRPHCCADCPSWRNACLHQHHRGGGTAIWCREDGIATPLGTAANGAVHLDVLAVESPADFVYGELRARLERTGRPIGANDLIIAAQALALGFTIVIGNEREFRRIDELSVENWLR